MISSPLPRSEYAKHLEQLGDKCAFCEKTDSLDIKEYEHWTLSFAAFPYRKYHTILFSKRHRIQFGEFSAEELAELGEITTEVNEMYAESKIVSKESTFGDQLYFSWRNRTHTEAEKKAVSHFHLHIYPETGKKIAIVLDEEAWIIDMNKLRVMQ